MQRVLKLGFYGALGSFIGSATYSIVQFLQVLKVLSFPWDEILIYSSSLAIAPSFLVAILALHHTPKGGNIMSHAALLFAVLYAVFAFLVYTVQLSIGVPAVSRGETGPLQVLILTPHSLFWVVDALAYICMGISTLFAAFVFDWQGREKWIRGLMLANGLMVPVIMLVYFYPHFSIPLLLMASPWCITCPGSMLLLAIYFMREKFSTQFL